MALVLFFNTIALVLLLGISFKDLTPLLFLSIIEVLWVLGFTVLYLGGVSQLNINIAYVSLFFLCLSTVEMVIGLAVFILYFMS